MTRPSAWAPLSLTTPSAHLRQLANLSPTEATAALGLPPLSPVTTVTSPEQRERHGASPRLTSLLSRAHAYGLQLEIRVRRV